MADFTALKTAIQNAIKQNGNEEITGNLLQEVLLAIVTTLGDGSINDLITALGSEATTRSQADGTLQQNIEAEATTRGNADTALQQNIDAEATTRGNADTALGGRIDGVVSSIEAINNAIENGYVYAGIATPSSTPASGKLFYLALTAGTYTNFGNIAVTQGINILKYNGSTWSLDAFIGIDDAPTPSSNNLVKSGGAFDEVMKNGSAFDLSAYNGGATYADLNAALTALNALPAAYKRGGMSVKFVQSSDNKYIQARCMAQNFTTDVTQWQGVDSEPTAGSENLVKSGGVFTGDLKSKLFDIPYLTENTTFNGAITILEIKNFIRDFKVLITRDTDYDYALFHFNTGLPAGTSYAYFLGLYKYPTGATPTPWNITPIASFTSETKPNFGIITMQSGGEDIAKVLVDWDSVSVFGGSNEFSGSGSGLRYNQDYIFNLNVGEISELGMLNSRVLKSDIVDDFSSTSSEKVLSAKQGTRLNKQFSLNDALYLSPNSTFVETDDLYIKALEIAGFIRDFKVLIEKEEGYNYALFHFNNGVTSLSQFAYFIGLYKYPSNSTPNLYNIVNVGYFNSATKPSNGVCDIKSGSTTVAKVLVNWDAVPRIIGGGAEQTGSGLGLRYNQDYIFDLSSGLIGTELRLKYLEDNPVSNEVNINLPDKIYAIVGDTLQIFYRGIIQAVNPYKYDILITCDKGKQYSRYFEYTPEVSDIGTDTFTVTIKDDNRNVIVEKTCQLITKDVVSSPSTEKKVLCFGDSLTASGDWCKEALRRLVGVGGTPAGKELSNIEFCGSMHNGDAGYFGIGGWSWNHYITAGNPAYRFQVSGVSSLSIGSIYSNNGNSFTIKEINITEGSGNILCQVSSLSPAPTTSGTLTKTSGNGDETITFSSVAQDAQNPLWDVNADKMTFIPYANEVSDGKIDVVITLLSWNSLSSAGQTDFTNIVNQAKTFIDTLHSEFPNAKVKLLGLQIPSVNGGLGANYGATGMYHDYLGLVVDVLGLNKAYQDLANDANYSSFVEFVNVSTQFDSEYNMPQAQVAVNTRNAATETRGTNGVHPDTSGYYQIADIVYRALVNELCQ